MAGIPNVVRKFPLTTIRFRETGFDKTGTVVSHEGEIKVPWGVGSDEAVLELLRRLRGEDRSFFVLSKSEKPMKGILSLEDFAKYATLVEDTPKGAEPSSAPEDLTESGAEETDEEPPASEIPVDEAPTESPFDPPVESSSDAFFSGDRFGPPRFEEEVEPAPSPSVDSGSDMMSVDEADLGF